MIEQHHRGFGRGHNRLNLIQLALSHQGRRVRPRAPLNHGRRDGGSGATRQLLKLLERRLKAQLCVRGLERLALRFL